MINSLVFGQNKPNSIFTNQQQLVPTQNNDYVSKLLESIGIKVDNNDVFRNWLNSQQPNSQLDFLNNIKNISDTAFGALKTAGLGWGIFSSINDYQTQKSLNKKHLENLGLKNEALRFEIDNRRDEVNRLKQIRNNVNRQLINTSAIKTSY